MWTPIGPLSKARNFLPSMTLPYLFQIGQKLKYTGETTDMPEIPTSAWEPRFLIESGTELECIDRSRGILLPNSGQFRSSHNPFDSIFYEFKGTLVRKETNRREPGSFWISEAALREKVFGDERDNWQTSCTQVAA